VGREKPVVTGIAGGAKPGTHLATRRKRFTFPGLSHMPLRRRPGTIRDTPDLPEESTAPSRALTIPRGNE